MSNKINLAKFTLIENYHDIEDLSIEELRQMVDLLDRIRRNYESEHKFRYPLSPAKLAKHIASQDVPEQTDIKINKFVLPHQDVIHCLSNEQLEVIDSWIRQILGKAENKLEQVRAEEYKKQWIEEQAKEEQLAEVSA